MDRRTALGVLAATPTILHCRREPVLAEPGASPIAAPESRIVLPDPVKKVEPLGAQWRTLDPFLFCVHHDDAYPAGNAKLGPASPLVGREIGSDFGGKDGWNMYHGQVVPGFPSHPHRGFETVTVVRRGLVDHSDSLGAAARYGAGDVQWLTAGRGIVHAEMFPLLDASGANPLELFQIWLNLPSTDKLTDPHFSMLWSSKVPKTTLLDGAGKRTEVVIVAGKLGELVGAAPPPKSWASRGTSDVAIWTLKMQPGAKVTVPKAAAGTNRAVYFFRGESLKLGTRTVKVRHMIELRADMEAPFENGAQEAELLMLQGRPIAEPVARHGPFVMNTPEEIQKAYADYRATRFGGWPWKADDPVHDRDTRFARHADGRLERAG